MIIKEETNEEFEIDNLGFEDEGEEAVIDTDDMHFIFEMFSDKMYNYPIESIVRELTSNCFDAHAEADVDEPVLIEGKYVGDEFMIHFVDNGVGISPERWKKVISKFLKSTKRKSNKFLGAFGLGSKSPFSYTSVYFIDTVFDGIEYNYMWYKNDKGIPSHELLSSKETYKVNGTTVRFVIKGGKYGSDYYKFEKALNSQLNYFDNVYVTGFEGFDNNYKIYEEETFKYRLNTKEETMHIALDKVKYPIDWKALSMQEIRIPVGVKFEIGELMVKKNREFIDYTEETKQVLKEKINKCLEVLMKYLSKGSINLETYFNEELYIRNISINEKVKIPVHKGYYGIDERGNTIHYPFNMPPLQIQEFVGLPIQIPKNPFFIFSLDEVVVDGKLKKNKKGYSEDLWSIRKNYKIFRTKEFKADKYKLFKIKNAIIVKRASLSVTEIASKLGLLQKSKKNRKENVTGVYKGNYLGIDVYNKKDMVNVYKKHMTNLLISLSQSYDNFFVSIEDINNYKAIHSRPKRKFIVEEGFVGAIKLNSTYDLIKHEYSLKALNKKGHIVVYAENKHKESLKALVSLFKSRTGYFNNYFYVMQVNKSEIPKMEALDTSLTVEDFIQNNKVFKEEATKLISERLMEEVKTLPKFIRELVPSLETLHQRVIRYSKNGINRYMSNTPLGKELINIINECELYDKAIISETKKYIKICEELKSLYLFDLSSITDVDILVQRDLASFLVKKGFIPDSLYTTKFTEVEYKWMEESVNLALYYESISSFRNKHKFKINNQAETWKNYQKLLKQNKSERISTLF